MPEPKEDTLLFMNLKTRIKHMELTNDQVVVTDTLKDDVIMTAPQSEFTVWLFWKNKEEDNG